MKKIKLLTPILGLTTIGAAVIPMASCSLDISHIKEPLIADKDAVEGSAYYVLVLDSEDYEAKDFSVSVSIPEGKQVKELKGSDFAASCELSADKLIVHVTFVGSVDEAVKVDLNLDVKYGSVWTNTVPVKMGLEASSSGVIDKFELKNNKYIATFNAKPKTPYIFHFVSKSSTKLSYFDIEDEKEEIEFDPANVIKNGKQLKRGKDALDGDWYLTKDDEIKFNDSCPIEQNDDVVIYVNYINISETTKLEARFFK